MLRARSVWLTAAGLAALAWLGMMQAVAQEPAAAEGKRWLIAAGVKEYSDWDIPGRTEGEFYAWAVANRLLDPKLGGIPVEQGGVLLGSEATSLGLKECFATVAGGTPQDVLFVYLCLTPAVLPAADGSAALYLCVAGTDKTNIAETALPLADLVALLKACPAERKIVFLDFSAWDAFHPEGVAAELQPKEDCYAGLAEVCTLVSAASPGEKLAEDPIKRPLLGFCLSNVPDGLTSVAERENGDGEVVVSELWAYIKATAEVVYKDAGTKQTPMAQGKSVVPTLYCKTAPPEPACPAGMRLVGDSLCVDVYEAPNLVGAMPMVNQNLFGFSGYCQQHGKRTCEPEEWEQACQGPDGFMFGYGSRGMAGVCNLGWLDPEAAKAERIGSRPLCVNGYGLHDMVGNVAEYVGHGNDTSDQRGGSFLDQNVEGTSCLTAGTHQPVMSADYVGSRCCADAKK